MRVGSSGIASKLLDAGCQPTKLYIIEDCGVKLAEILQASRPSDPYRRSEEVLRTKTPSQAAAEGDLETLETYRLRDEDFSKVDGQGKTPLQHAVEREQVCVWPILGVQSHQKTGSHAFAALRVDGSVVTWGSPEYGGDCSKVKAQLTVDVQHIYATNGAFAALKADGSVVTWGHPDFGGDCTKVQQQLAGNVQSIQETSGAFAALKLDGSVVAWGHKDAGGDSNTIQEQLARDVQSIYPAYGTYPKGAFAALKADGSVVAWGQDPDRLKINLGSK